MGQPGACSQRRVTSYLVFATEYLACMAMERLDACSMNLDYYYSVAEAPI